MNTVQDNIDTRTLILGQFPGLKAISQVQISEDDFLKMLHLNTNVEFHNKKITELKIGHIYKVNSFKNVTTKFGNKCIANLFDPSEFTNSPSFDLFLPSRFSNIPTKSNINNIGLIYEGLSKTSNGQDYHKIIFT